MGGNGREREWAFQAWGTALVMAGRSRTSLQFKQERRAFVGVVVDERGLAFISPDPGYPKSLRGVYAPFLLKENPVSPS